MDEIRQTTRPGIGLGWSGVLLRYAGLAVFLYSLVCGLVMVTARGRDSFAEGRFSHTVEMVKNAVDFSGGYSSNRYSDMRFGLDDFRCNGVLLLCTGAPIGLFVMLLEWALSSKSSSADGYISSLGIVTILASIVVPIILRGKYGNINEWCGIYRGVHANWYGWTMLYGSICGVVIFLWGIRSRVLRSAKT